MSLLKFCLIKIDTACSFFELHYGAETTDNSHLCNSVPSFSRRHVLERIESVILGIVTSLSKDEAPVLLLPNRSSWTNVR